MFFFSRVCLALFLWIVLSVSCSKMRASGEGNGFAEVSIKAEGWELKWAYTGHSATSDKTVVIQLTVLDLGRKEGSVCESLRGDWAE